ncbi:hypothetical protein [Caloranaerobacter sp. TR13]|uniref:hypothetical protein n=1 Tax=Caloranaerobacter sp. TR13 TaxID=1302151 RepID=UPI0006D47D0A|nr:hypothetical protein [Caloranaerobacter sp. TR13]
MKNFIEKFKDFLYDIIDHVIIIGVIVIVIGIIGWRLDILFADNLVKAPLISSEDANKNNSSITSINENTSIDISENNMSENPIDDTEINDSTQNDNENNQIDFNESEKDANLNDTQNNKIVVIKIPKGSLGPAIAEILLKEGLINSKTEFLNRAKELKLDTKLKAGSFKIESNSSLDKIIKIIAGAI